MTTLGFIGLGSMGRAMARRLIEAGFEVMVWNRTAGPVEELVVAGALAASSVNDALEADICFSMLANDEAADSVLTAEAVQATPRGVHVMMSSISMAMADRLADRFASAGTSYAACPVLGRPEVAAAGHLNVLAAADAAVIDVIMPYLEVLGQRVWRLGERPAIANGVKAAVNYNIIHAMQAIGESVAMTERIGVAPEQFTELLSSTLFGGVVYNGYGSIIARQAYRPPGFHVALGRKDLGLAQELAETGGVQPLTMPALIEVFDRALADPQLSDGDWSIIAEVTRGGRSDSDGNTRNPFSN